MIAAAATAFVDPSSRPRTITCVMGGLLLATVGAVGAEPAKTSFTADLSTKWDDAGGIVAHDVDDDGDFDLIISQKDRIVAYDQDGTKLWRHDLSNMTGGGATESRGGAGRFGPGFQIGDVDGDGVTEVIYLVKSNQMKVLSGRDGSLKQTVDLPTVESHHNRWDMAILADFQGGGDRDVLLVAAMNVGKGYQRNRKIAAFGLADLLSQGPDATPAWMRDDFICQSHGHPVVVDLNLDGRDEVVGGNIISHAGEVLVDTGVPNTNWPHIDGVSVGDIDPDRPGLECILGMERLGKKVVLYNIEGVIWEGNRTGTDADKVTVGEWDADRPGLETHMRGADADDMEVWDSTGDVVAAYDFDATVNPQTWTDEGVENMHRTFWTGGPTQQIAAKERHMEGDVGLLDPMTAEFSLVLDEQCNRLYTADIRGDWRDELIVISGNTVTIYENTAANPNPDAPSLWTDPNYRRQHMTHNYYTGVGGGDFPQATE